MGPFSKSKKHDFIDIKTYFRYGGDIQDYLSNLSIKRSFLYQETPKVACSTIKRRLQLIENPETLLKGISKREFSPLIKPSEAGIPLSEIYEGSRFFRFSFVRNPFTRILSAYLHKILIRREKNIGLINGLGFQKGEKISFLAFLERIESIPDHHRDIHLMSQFELLRPDKVDYHFIGRFERFEYDFLQIVLRLEASPATDSINIHATNAAHLIADYYCEKEINLVKKIYANDFAAFYYSGNIENVLQTNVAA